MLRNRTPQEHYKSLEFIDKYTLEMFDLGCKHKAIQKRQLNNSVSADTSHSRTDELLQKGMNEYNDNGSQKSFRSKSGLPSDGSSIVSIVSVQLVLNMGQASFDFQFSSLF